MSQACQCLLCVEQHAQRDRSRDKIAHYRKRAKYEKAGRLAAEAVVQAVRQLHVHDGSDLIGDETCCRECGVGLPCPTIAALAGVPVDSTEEKRNG